MQNVFLISCVRSGTSWLQGVLSTHAGIATARETHLFDGYIGKMYSAWEKEANDLSETDIALIEAIAGPCLSDLGYAAHHAS